ncbi:MAG TPA: tRNA uridine-5-carboxymethylaminomethyl(34) synthesis GTPase MnmE, partial [Allosphingosinicella sp.]
VSARTGEGLGQLAELLIARSKDLLPAPGEVAVNRRHRKLLAECQAMLRDSAAAEDMLIAAESLRQARAALDRITGGAGIEEMLDTLFERFCIGK